MAVSFNSYYLYKKYEKRVNQPWLPVYPETLSIDGDGSMPKVLKTSGDPACQPIYRLVETEDTICVEVFDKKYKLTLQDLSTVTAECDTTSALTRDEISAYSASVTSAIVGDCVTSLNARAFYNCSGLTSVTIPDSVTSIGEYMFAFCSGLTQMIIPSGVTSIAQRTFIGCISLTSCTIPDSVTSIGNNAFNGCSGLTSINIPSGVISIGQYAFGGCSSLTGATVEATTPPTLGNNAFFNTNNCPIYVPSGSVNTYKAASGWSSYSSRIQAII